MKELSDEQIEKILELLRKGILLPEDDRLSLIKYLEQTKIPSFLIPKKNMSQFMPIKSGKTSKHRVAYKNQRYK